MPTLYLSDGTANNKIKKLYYSDGTANSKLKSLYESDGTAWYKVFGGYDCQVSLTYTASIPNDLGIKVCTLNDDSSGEIYFRTLSDSSSSSSTITITFMFMFEKKMSYKLNQKVFSFVGGTFAFKHATNTNTYVYDADGSQLRHYSDIVRNTYSSTNGTTTGLKIKYSFLIKGDGDTKGYLHITWDALQVFGQDLNYIQII